MSHVSQVMVQSLRTPWFPGIIAGLEMEVGKYKTSHSPTDSDFFSFPDAILNSPSLVSATLKSVDSAWKLLILCGFVSSLAMEFLPGLDFPAGKEPDLEPLMAAHLTRPQV